MLRTSKVNSAMGLLPLHPVVGDLLVPIVAFLRKSGMPNAQLMSEWCSAVKRASRANKGGGLKVVKIGFEHLGSTVISRWLRDPKYLNHAGRPDDLPLRGKRSIASLVKEGRVKIPLSKVLVLLVELGTVREVAPSRYRLIRRSMNYIIPQYLPFEPNFRFLIDAARACTAGSGLPPKTPRLFWLNAYSTRVHQKYTPEFLRFTKERGLSFMHEINDWLESHESPNAGAPISQGKAAKMRRLGLGLYGICSSPD